MKFLIADDHPIIRIGVRQLIANAWADATILEAVKRRTEVSKLIGKARMASGGTRLVHSREMTEGRWIGMCDPTCQRCRGLRCFCSQRRPGCERQ